MQMSKQYKTSFYTIHAVSNMHAGKGDSTYGIIDKEVQRDVISNLPTIHASGLKGAFRELFTCQAGENEEELKKVEFVFGTKKGSSDGKEGSQIMGNDRENQPGAYNFHNAHLLVLPVRSNHNYFYRATSPAVLGNFLNQLEHFDTTFDFTASLEALSKLKPKEGSPIIFDGTSKVLLEALTENATKQDWPSGVNQAAIAALLGERIAICHEADFKGICEELPVIARNYLENGISRNLWYEEVVPRESRFYFALAHPANNTYFAEFMKECKQYAQIGGNASVGYGYCKIEKLEQ